MVQTIIRKMVDWLIVIFLIAFVLWFMMVSPVWQSSSSPILQADPITLRHHVEELSNNLSPRIADYSGYKPAAHYILNTFKQYGKANFQPFVTGVGTFSNVVARFGPNTKKVIVLGAHYDSEDSVPGADDNASGVAALLEVARLLSENENKLTVQVQLVAYALGDGMYFGSRDMGSFYHAERLKKKKKEVVMLSVDSIGYFSSAKNSQRYPYRFMRWFYPDKGNYILVSGRLQDVGLARKVKGSFTKVERLDSRSLNAPEMFPNIAESDQLSYWLLGFSAVRVSDTSSDRNVAYRTDKDLPINLDYDAMARVTQALYEYLNDYAY